MFTDSTAEQPAPAGILLHWQYNMAGERQAEKHGLSREASPNVSHSDP